MRNLAFALRLVLGLGVVASIAYLGWTYYLDLCAGKESLLVEAHPKPQVTPNTRDQKDHPELPQSQVIEGLVRQLEEEGKDSDAIIGRLSRFGPSALPQVVPLFQSKDADVRRWAAEIVLEMGRDDDRSTAVKALYQALELEKSERVLERIVIAIAALKPKDALSVLLKAIDTKAPHEQAVIVKGLDRLGQDLGEAKVKLTNLLNTDVQELQMAAFQVLSRMGLSREDCRTLGDSKITFMGWPAGDLFCELVMEPDRAVRFLERTPGLLRHVSCPPHTEILIDLVEGANPDAERLRQAVLARQDLPDWLMAWVGSPRYLPVLTEKISKADSYSVHFLKACSRACGGPLGPVVELSETERGTFMPRSAQPGGDETRMFPKMSHGDGVTSVLITGTLSMEDGSPVLNPKFTDRSFIHMSLLKDKTHPLKYEPASKRFVYVAMTGAAIATGEGKQEPGPYSTSELEVRITGKGAKSLNVSFFDEMPEVKIILRKAAE